LATLDSILSAISAPRLNSPGTAACTWHPSSGVNDIHYAHTDPRLAISFQVEKIPSQALQVMDPRLVRIAPGSTNEKHRHAHEAIFIVLSGQGEIQIGNSFITLEPGGTACVPRWVVHQCRNRSASHELVLLAITDFSLTSAVLGDYDARTRLKNGGADAFREDRQVEGIQADEPEASPRSTTDQPNPDMANRRSVELLGQQRRGTECEDPEDRRTAARYVDDLAGQALMHRAVSHPYLKALSAGTLPDLHFALGDFARHYYGYSAHFPRFLTALISRLEKPDHRKPLLANLTEESGHYEPEALEELSRCGIEADWIVGIPHPELFQRFRHAMGVSGTDPASVHLEVVAWRELLLGRLSNGSPAEALGALGLGTECIVQTIYQPFVDAIRQLSTPLNPRDSVFFQLHTVVDDQHQATLRMIAIDFATTSAGRVDLAKGMHMALAMRDSFWSWLHERALCCDVAIQPRQWAPATTSSTTHPPPTDDLTRPCSSAISPPGGAGTAAAAHRPGQ
jgi:quercetin dioxygenase-like cupin family protein/pyrroloquinoline quinone (PQQ) biosynthesis protein C